MVLKGGKGYQLYDADDNWINIVGLVYYTDSVGNKTGSALSLIHI